MDAQAPDREILLAEYRFLRQLNQVTAAAEALADAAVARAPATCRERLEIVDFGSGGADIPERALATLARRGWSATCLCTDRSPEAIEIGEATPRAGLSFRVVDVVRATETLRPKCCDISHASLVLHHLGDADVVEALRQMGAVARHAVVWNDLVRDRIGVVGAWLSTIGRRAELRRDAVVSVRRGFTLAEATTLGEAAGLVDIAVRRVRGARFVLCGAPGPAIESDGARRPLVRASSLSVRYGSREVLADFSMVARCGELLLVGGPNGAGKSTLLACLAGALRPQRGSVWIDRTVGHPGFHPQEGGLFTSLSVARNLEIFASLSGSPRDGRGRAIDSVIDRFGLRGHVARTVAELSGGLRRRAAIAACLVHDPGVAILDEPDAGLDGAGRATLVHEIQAILARGGTVVIASHTPAWLEDMNAVSRRIGLPR